MEDNFYALLEQKLGLEVVRERSNESCSGRAQSQRVSAQDDRDSSRESGRRKEELESVSKEVVLDQEIVRPRYFSSLEQMRAHVEGLDEPQPRRQSSDVQG